MKFLSLIFIFQLFLIACNAGNNVDEKSEVEVFGTEVTPAILKTGAERLDVLLPMLQNKNVALVINHTSVVGKNLTSLLDTLLVCNVKVKKVFAPEHGFRGDADAGETVKNSKDVKTGVPVVSIYGRDKKPTCEQLSGIDVVVFDLQDVGARFFTYISTMHYVMEACAENNKEMIICDRPNPNDYVDGPVLQSGYRSFVGMHPVPVLHGLTVGELALMINGEGWLKNKVKLRDLKVVEIKGWKHGQAYLLPVKPSPNLPDEQAVKLYPSLCFFEATNFSVGRGTLFPFQVIGAPEEKYGNFSFTPRSLPGWDKSPLHKDIPCYGADLRNINFQGGLSLKFLLEFYDLSQKKALFFTRPDWFNLLAGNKVLQEQILSGMDEVGIRESWMFELDKYKQLRTKYLLYSVQGSDE